MTPDFPLRVVVIGFSILVISWSWPAAAAMVRWRFTRALYADAAWFWIAVTTMLFQAAYWCGVTLEWRILLLAGMIIGLGLASMGRVRVSNG